MSDFGATPVMTELPVPEPEPGEVRVRVRAASVNGFDLAVVRGYLNDYFPYRFPLVIGKDFAGEVDVVGPDVTDYLPGDRVFGVVTKPFLREGAFAEYVTVPTSVGLAKLPDAVPFSEGAVLGLAGAAAHDCVDRAELETGQTALVVGATGGVGNLLVQLATASGVQVIATAHTDEEKRLLTRLGAEATIDHTAADVVRQTRELAPEGVDVVFHLAGEPTVVEAVRDGGRFVSLLVVTPEQVPTSRVSVVPIAADPTSALLDTIVADHASGATTVTVQESFPLEQTAEAMAAFARGTLGKVLITTD